MKYMTSRERINNQQMIKEENDKQHDNHSFLPIPVFHAPGWDGSQR